MTEKIYDLDSYRLSFRAVVMDSFVRDGRSVIVLDRTCFFPEGGGQPSDTGSIGGAYVDYVCEEGDEILHFADRTFEKGTEVDCSVDFERRFLHMQIHTGEHILSGMIQSLFGVRNVGFHMGAEFNTIDLDRELSVDMIRKAELEANIGVWKNEPVKVYYPDPEELGSIPMRKRPVTDKPLRVVVAGGSDVCACCGTHVAFTGEVGIIKVVRHEKYKGGSRLTFLCGRQALEDYDMKNFLLREAGNALSLPPEEVMKGIERMKRSVEEEKAEVAALSERIVSLRASALVADAVERNGAVIVISSEDGMSVKELLALSGRIGESGRSASFLFSDGRFVFSSSCDVDVRAISSEMSSRFGCRGGGRPSLSQGGTGGADVSEIIAWLNSVLF